MDLLFSQTLGSGSLFVFSIHFSIFFCVKFIGLFDGK